LIISAVTLSVLYWLYPNQSQQSLDSTDEYSNNSNPSQLHKSPKNINQLDTSFNSTSQMDTEIDCKLQFNSAQHLIVNERTRNCFEYFISQYGERNIDEIRHNFQLYIAKTFQASQQQQILALWSRYVDYRKELSKLQVQQPAQESYQYFQTIFNSMHDLKQRFFSNTEIEGLFGSEDIYQQYTLDRMKILENNGLDASAKAKQLQQRFEQLPQDWQDNLKIYLSSMICIH
jgi:lipase chaperone LimK